MRVRSSKMRVHSFGCRSFRMKFATGFTIYISKFTRPRSVSWRQPVGDYVRVRSALWAGITLNASSCPTDSPMPTRIAEEDAF